MDSKFIAKATNQRSVLSSYPNQKYFAIGGPERKLVKDRRIPLLNPFHISKDLSTSSTATILVKGHPLLHKTSKEIPHSVNEVHICIIISVAKITSDVRLVGC